MSVLAFQPFPQGNCTDGGFSLSLLCSHLKRWSKNPKPTINERETWPNLTFFIPHQMFSRCLLTWRKSFCQPLLPSRSGCASFPSHDLELFHKPLLYKTSWGWFSRLCARWQEGAKPSQLNPSEAG